MKEDRPWGWFEVLYDGSYKVKRIHVNPGKRLSLQSHERRCEYWCVVHGVASAVKGDAIHRLHQGDTIRIDYNEKHRLINDSDSFVEIVEIQTGEYFGEDDIKRYEDDYGRS